MTPEGNRHTDPRETDPETLAKLLEIELMQKRAGWQQAKARRSTYRTMSFLFLFAVIVAAFVAFYLFATSEHRVSPRGAPGRTASP
jgi:hypothetical protein